MADVAPLALCGEADWRAHAVFQGLFVQGVHVESDGLLFERRQGSRGADGPRLAMLAAGPGALSWECDYEKLARRYGDAGIGDALTMPLPGGTGATLNPVGALRMALTLAPGMLGSIYDGVYDTIMAAIDDYNVEHFGIKKDEIVRAPLQYEKKGYM